MPKNIAVFGSSLPQPGDYEYFFAENLGRLLGINGYAVITGGYQGVMDAVSKGCRLAGSKAIGITVKSFASKRSEWLSEEIKTESLFERLEKLILLSDAYIVLPGGTGTLVELALAWECVNKNICERKPVICDKKSWELIVNYMKEILAREKRISDFIYFFENPEEVIKILKENLRV